MISIHKDVLDRVPTAAIVVDSNFKVRYTNRAFREYFRSERARGAFRDVISCGERSEKVCGEGVKCAYCALRNVFVDAKKNGGKAFRKLILRGEQDDVAFRIKVEPMGKYYLGIVDNAYETEIAREM